MNSSYKFSTLRKILIFQLSIIVLGAITVYASFYVSASSLAEKDFEREKLIVSSEIQHNQDSWRAWAELGLSQPLSEEIRNFKDKYGLENLDVKQIKDLNRKEYDVIIPKLTSTEDINGYAVVVKLSKKTALEILISQADIIYKILLLVALFVLASTASVLYLRKKIHLPIIRLISTMQKNVEGKHLDIATIEASDEIKVFINEIASLYAKIKENERVAAIGILTAQVTHDLLSPVGALEVISEISDLPLEQKEILNSSISRIKSIAGALLAEARSSSVTKKVSDLLEEAINLKIFEKRLHKNSISLSMNESIDFTLSTEVAEFQRVLSNLLNNAIEAYDSSEVVIKIDYYTHLGKKIISIQDFGRGIPTDILQQVGSFGKTFSKKNGTGIGLHHAINIVKGMGGELEITSSLKSGTTVKMIFP